MLLLRHLIKKNRYLSNFDFFCIGNSIFTVCMIIKKENLKFLLTTNV